MARRAARRSPLACLAGPSRWPDSRLGERHSRAPSSPPAQWAGAPPLQTHRARGVCSTLPAAPGSGSARSEGGDLGAGARGTRWLWGADDGWRRVALIGAITSSSARVAGAGRLAGRLQVGGGGASSWARSPVCAPPLAIRAP